VAPRRRRSYVSSTRARSPPADALRRWEGRRDRSRERRGLSQAGAAGACRRGALGATRRGGARGREPGLRGGHRPRAPRPAGRARPAAPLLAQPEQPSACGSCCSASGARCRRRWRCVGGRVARLQARAGRYGVTGVERVPFWSPSPVARVYGAAARTLGISPPLSSGASAATSR
jgi:hypothetical protein